MLLKTDHQSLSSHSIMNGRNWNTMQMMTMMMKKKMIKGNIQKHMYDVVRSVLTRKEYQY